MKYEYSPIPNHIKDIVWVRLIKKDPSNKWHKDLPLTMNIGDITWVERNHLDNMCLFENNKYCANFPTEWFEEVNQTNNYEIY
jgi:hypothetical protein